MAGKSPNDSVPAIYLRGNAIYGSSEILTLFERNIVYLCGDLPLLRAPKIAKAVLLRLTVGEVSPVHHGNSSNR